MSGNSMYSEEDGTVEKAGCTATRQPLSYTKGLQM